MKLRLVVHSPVQTVESGGADAENVEWHVQSTHDSTVTGSQRVSERNEMRIEKTGDNQPQHCPIA